MYVVGTYQAILFVAILVSLLFYGLQLILWIYITYYHYYFIIILYNLYCQLYALVYHKKVGV